MKKKIVKIKNRITSVVVNYYINIIVNILCTYKDTTNLLIFFFSIKKNFYYVIRHKITATALFEGEVSGQYIL